MWLRTVLGTSGFRNVRRPLATSFEGLHLHHFSPPRFPKHPGDSGFHLLAPNLNELFDASSSSKNLRVDASSSSAYPWGTFGYLRQSFGSRHLREGAIPNSSPSRARSDSGRPNPRKNKNRSRHLCESVSPEGRRWARPEGMLLHVSRYDLPSF